MHGTVIALNMAQMNADDIPVSVEDRGVARSAKVDGCIVLSVFEPVIPGVDHRGVVQELSAGAPGDLSEQPDRGAGLRRLRRKP